jgi:F-type H+-transporting ATPase subunit b
MIDWFTVGAQALNFLLLVWLLKRFLYKPVLDAIDSREKAVAASVADAEAKKAEAQKDRDEFKRKNDDFDAQRAALLAKATADAATESARLKEEARKSADALAAKYQASALGVARTLDRAVGLRLRGEVFAIARKALGDLAGADLQERMVAAFTRRLATLGEDAKRALGEALKAGPDPSLLRCAVDLAPEQRAAIQQALNVAFSADIHFKVETAPELVGGIEILAKGQKLGWTVDDYLGSLESDVGRLIEKGASEGKPEAKSEPKSEAKPEGKGTSALAGV